MSTKSYWNLLVLFGILCQGIIGTLSERDTDESSDVLVRQKRVINHSFGGDVRVPIGDFPYVVAIKQFRGTEFCVGVILTRNIVLTVANCVENDITKYRVYSGSAQVLRYTHSISHNITSRRINIPNHPSRPNDGIALITVDPPFHYSSSCRNIEFYVGNIHPGLHGSVYGWGCKPIGHPGTEHPDRLRSITVPIISKDYCNTLYYSKIAISDSDICTLDATGNQYCGANDPGAPLVFEVDDGEHKLVGLYLWNGGFIGQSINPDVFVNLQHPVYKAWIEENVKSVERYLNNPNQNQHLLHSPNIHQNQHLPHSPNIYQNEHLLHSPNIHQAQPHFHNPNIHENQPHQHNLNIHQNQLHHPNPLHEPNFH